MSFFRRPDYISEITEFIDQLKVDNPKLEAEQREGRALQWDKKVDRAAWAGYKKAQVPQNPYVYHHPSPPDPTP